MAAQVLTCNVQRASAVRARRQVNWLVGTGADVLVLTEVSAGDSGGVLAELLLAQGFGVLLPEPATGDRYRVLLAVRDGTPLGVDIGVGSWGHRCVAARAVLSGAELGVVGVYVPSRGQRDRRNLDKRAFQDCVAGVLPDVERILGATGPVVIAGDLNVVEPDHEPRYAVFGGWEYDFYRAFGHAGFVDAFRFVEPVGMEYSWFGRASVDGRRNGYRFDHVFVSQAHCAAVLDCRYDHSVRAAGLTDHSALALTLGGTAV